MRWRFPIILLVVLALFAAACGDDDTTETTAAGGTDAPTTTAAAGTDAPTTTAVAPTDAPTTTATPDVCAIDNLELVQAGTLTVGTGDPAFPPWVSGLDGANFDDPESKTGFEAALVYAIAAEMGFSDDQVAWVRTGFDEAIAPGPKTFDFNLQQYSITEVRDEVVDFSDPYYVTRQSLVSLAGTSVIGATTLGDLADARLGAQIGTTSLDFIENVIAPSEQASVYDTNVDAIAALIAGQLDGIVVDLPTAFFMTAVQIPEQGADGIIVAQFQAPAQDPDEYGLLFADGNSLVGCVNAALETLRSNGTLASLEGEWLTSGGEIVTISE
jgi:polar amino acid transport system substrate-binding protein